MHTGSLVMGRVTKNRSWPSTAPTAASAIRQATDSSSDERRGMAMASADLSTPKRTA